MDETREFLEAVMPRMQEEVLALHNGDLNPRLALWSRRDPVTLFGAELTGSGWAEIEPIFQRLAASFAEGRSCEYEVLAAGVSGDLGYVVAIERSEAANRGGDLRAYALRVTTILRREEGRWRIVHRHGDPFDAGAREALRERMRRAEQPGGSS